jgi:anion-transporting  ArsA/GET3 family ATPase
MSRVESKSLQFVVGKGGVGKSTVAAALAVAYAHRGLRVLAVEIGPPGGLERLLSPGARTSPEPLAVRENLWLARVEGDAALAEYLALIVPIKRLLQTVIGSRVYKTFVAAAPGLKELMAIGKVWFEHGKKDENGERLWDVIVVDAGASGHSLQYLQMPAAAAETFASGLVHREATRVKSLLEDPETTAVHVVATPEEMPAAEAEQILARLHGDLSLPVGNVFLNRCRAASPGDATEEVRCLRERVEAGACDVAVRGLVDDVLLAAENALAWESIQERVTAAFCAKESETVVRLPLLETEEFGDREIARLSELVLADGEEEGRS